MSVVGLKQSEIIAKSLNRKVKASLVLQAKEVKSEIEKLRFLLGDTQATLTWRNSPADGSRIAKILADLEETERLYLTAGDTEAANLFKRRVKKQLEQRLTNLKANELEVTIKAEQFRARTAQSILQDLNRVSREGKLKELYSQSRNAGGFLSNTGRGFMQDLVTLETKSAGSKTLGAYMNNLYSSNEKALKDVFVKGVVRGDNYDKMISNLSSTANLSARKAELLITTEANAIFNDGVLEVIQNNPLVKGYRFRAVLDSRTSDICQEHDGEYIAKEDVMPGVNYPPLHPRCRSTVTTVLVDEDKRKDTFQRYTKNGSNEWERVPLGMTYTEFKDKYGFANSNNPSLFNARTRSIQDTTLAAVSPNIYTGYVKPSVSAVKRIDQMVSAYVNNDEDFMSAIKENTKQSSAMKAMFRQAQAESGFDGLPLVLDERAFDEQVTHNNYVKVYRQFTNAENLEEFKLGEQPFGKLGAANYGAGTYTFLEPPSAGEYGSDTTVLALKSKPSKILSFTNDIDSQIAIAGGLTPDVRINEVLSKVPPANRRDLLSTLAIQYGYDAIKVSSQLKGNYMLILNRTAAIVRGGR